MIQVAGMVFFQTAVMEVVQEALSHDLLQVACSRGREGCKAQRRSLHGWWIQGCKIDSNSTRIRLEFDSNSTLYSIQVNPTSSKVENHIEATTLASGTFAWLTPFA